MAFEEFAGRKVPSNGWYEFREARIIQIMSATDALIEVAEAQFLDEFLSHRQILLEYRAKSKREKRRIIFPPLIETMAAKKNLWEVLYAVYGIPELFDIDKLILQCEIGSD